MMTDLSSMDMNDMWDNGIDAAIEKFHGNSAVPDAERPVVQDDDARDHELATATV
jgi:hypothetical protein